MTNELQALDTSARLYDASRFELVKVTGKDRVGFLQRITTGNIQSAPVGGGVPTVLLSVRSHALFAMCTLVEETCVHLVVPSPGAANLALGLAKYAIMDDCQFEPVPDLGVLSILGKKATSALAEVGVDLPSELLSGPPFTHLRLEHPTWGSLWLAKMFELGHPSIWILAATTVRGQIAAAFNRLGFMHLSPETAEYLRILALEPRPESEITGDRFPVEIGLGGALDHNKGCYVGQETIVRMRDRGNCRRRLVLLRMSGTEACAKGDVIDAPSRITAGQVTSVGVLAGKQSVALALLATSVPVGVPVKIHHQGQLLDADVVSESPPWG